ncbi:hypothetical protein AB833_13170 [Chromatiales bacterium (ex Bugula neritina AB1)]|nr:hypothetical protein AB833_13170 [Chromatiales bacterium (ex Bugula neritina AB1)]
MDYEIVEGQHSDEAEIVALLPRLADFSVPEHRAPEELWHGDRDLVQAWAAGNRSDVRVAIARRAGNVCGVAVVSARKELLSGEASAHLEILAIDAEAEGLGIGTALLKEADKMALSLGAGSLSLHVFSNNHRARALYARNGFTDEISRYFKKLQVN